MRVLRGLPMGVVFVSCLIAMLAAFADCREKCCFLLCNLAACSGNHQLARTIFKVGRSGNLGQNHIDVGSKQDCINYVGYFGAVAKVRALSGRYDDALQFCDDALMCAPYYPPLRVNHVFGVAFHERSWVYRKIGNFPKALADEEKAFVLQSDNGDEYYYRALCYYLNHQYLDALDDLNYYVSMGSDSGAVALRAKVYDALGDTRLAALDRSRADKGVIISFDRQVDRSTHW
jgi:tetratricopeptide (TPR) repeat protein